MAYNKRKVLKYVFVSILVFTIVGSTSFPAKANVSNDKLSETPDSGLPILAVLDSNLTPTGDTTSSQNGTTITSSGNQDASAANTTPDYNGYTLLEPLPCLDSTRVDCQDGQVKKIDLDDFFQYAFNLLIALSAVAAVFMMTWGGFEYMTTDSWQGKENGKTKFNNAIIGLLMVLSAFLILKTVNPKLVEIPASIPKVKIPSSMAESSSSILDRLVADAGRFSQEAKTVLQKDMALQNDTKSAQEKIDQLNNQIKSGQLSEEEVTAAQVEMAKLQQQIGNNDTTVTLDTFKINIFNNTVVNGTVSTIGAGLDSGSLSEKQIDEYINDGIDYIEQQKQLAIKRLQNRNIVQGIYGTDSIEEIAMTAKILLSLKVLDMKINATTFTKTFTNSLPFGKLGSSIPDAHLGPTKISNASSNNMGQANVVSQKIDNALRSLEERSIGVTSSKLKQDITGALLQTQQDYKRVYKDYLIKH